jgi:hypothetical protein
MASQSSIDAATADLYARMFREGIASGRIDKWSELAPVGEVASVELERRWCTLEGEYRPTGHFETHPNFERRLFLEPRRAANLREGTRYRVEGVVGNCPIGGAGSEGRTIIAYAIEALTASAARDFGTRTIHARRAEGVASSTDPGFSPFDALIGASGEVRVAAALWFDGPNRTVARAQDRCRTSWAKMFGDAHPSSIFTVAEDPPPRDALELPHEPDALLHAVLEHLARATCAGTAKSLAVHATLIVEVSGRVLVVRHGAGAFGFEDEGQTSHASGGPPLVIIEAGAASIAGPTAARECRAAAWHVRFGDGLVANELCCTPAPSASATTIAAAVRVADDDAPGAGAATTGHTVVVVHGHGGHNTAWLPARLAARSLCERLRSPAERPCYWGAADRLPMHWGFGHLSDFRSADVTYETWAALVDRAPLRVTPAGVERGLLDLDRAIARTSEDGSIRGAITACTFAHLDGDRLWGLHVGIGRALRFRPGAPSLDELTQEHLVDVILRQRGEPVPAWAGNGNILAGALGDLAKEGTLVSLEHFSCALEAGDLVLISSTRIPIADAELQLVLEAAAARAASIDDVCAAIGAAIDVVPTQRSIAWALLAASARR